MMAKLPGRLPNCACCVAVMLAGHDVTATTTTTRVTAEQAPFLEYHPQTNVDEFAALDLDQRSIVARLATGDEEGLTEARTVYSNGRVMDDDKIPSVTLRDLSVRAGEQLVNSSTYKTFVDFYGGYDYADRWVTASFEGSATDDTFDFDFSQLEVEGRAAAIKFGIPLLHVWMHVVGLLEKAAANCQYTSGSNWESMVDWDKAVAIYTGSEPRESGAGGYFIHTLVTSECVKFGTCKKGDSAPVNTLVFKALNDGKNNLIEGYCAEASARASEIKLLMTIPIIQGLIRAAYALDVQNDFQETTQGMGAAFAAAILPLVSECNEGNAVVIYNDLKPGSSLKGSYEVVKASLERSYECLGINCEHVGGLVNLRGDGYLLGAEACNGLLPMSSEIDVVGGDLNGNEPYTHVDPFDVVEDVSPSVEVTGRESSAADTFAIVLILFGILNCIFLLGNVWACTSHKRKVSKEEINKMAISTMESLPSRNAFPIVIGEDDKGIV